MSSQKVEQLERAIKTFVESKSGFGSKRSKVKVIERVFEEFDRDGSGLVDEEEFLAALVRINIVGCAEDCLALFDKFDQDMSGAISYKEFIETLFEEDEGKSREDRYVIESKQDGASDGVITRVRERILSLAGKNAGIRSVTRILRQMDSDGNNSLNANELKEGLASYGVQTTGGEIKTLMMFFDRDQSGKISIEEFLRGLRGDMSRPRRKLVKKAWEQLIVACEKDGANDALTLSELMRFYDVSKNPEVMDGSLSPEDAMRHFIQLWDKDHDDRVEWKEFLEYYKDLSVGIERDDYFELMIRNSWHISGGSGWSENTSNIRCLVTFLDGQQKVIELKNDFGVSRNATKPELIRLLQRQGVQDISDVSLSY